MPYLIKPLEDDLCVFMSYQGQIPALELSAARYEALSELNGRRWTRMVVDVATLRSIPTHGELYDFATSLSLDAPPGTRVALVLRPEQTRLARVFETVARKHGVLLSTFQDLANARLWVKHTSDDSHTHAHKKKSTGEALALWQTDHRRAVTT